MRLPFLLAGALVLAGLAVLAYGASLGQVSVAFVLVFPIVIGTGPWGFLGGLLVMAGLLAASWAFAREHLRVEPQVEQAHYAGRGEVRTERWPEPEPPVSPGPQRGSGGFILLGPVPIAFGSTRELATKMLLLAVVVLALLLLLPVLLRGPA